MNVRLYFRRLKRGVVSDRFGNPQSGLTTGAAQAPEIGITPLGMRIQRPKTVGDDAAAKREALLKPKVVGEFLREYDGAALPPSAIAKNVLESKGVPTERLDGVLELIVEGARAVGFIREWPNGKLTVDLAGPVPTADEALAVPVPGQAHTTTTLTPAAVTPAATVSLSPGVHSAGTYSVATVSMTINIEIHIAADASSETVEEIVENRPDPAGQLRETKERRFEFRRASPEPLGHWRIRNKYGSGP